MASLKVNNERFLPKKGAFPIPKSVRFCETNWALPFIFNKFLASVVLF